MGLRWACTGGVLSGVRGWLLSADRAMKWLITNDPSFEPPGMISRLFVGRLFTSFGPMMRYAQLSKEKGESSNLVALFWGGFAFSICGVVVIFILI